MSASTLLAALLSHWRLDKPDVVAHDLGESTAFSAALLNRCEYRSLLLSDPVALTAWGS
ncbi:hypothetical protein [Paraburkholderia bannensis]|uniref:hypothetical protein n=1 Tax=Paraburkholderia bannensis TaxID=765414 RepID=UPI002AB60316|nr:hypothetical protein [Paraburkholderia bannensis]